MSMAYSVSDLILIAGAYLLFLFLVAWITEKGWIPARLVRHPAVYVFSLGVYASAWAIYGSVGYAHDYGYNFLAYFLGISGGSPPPTSSAPWPTCSRSATAAAWPAR